jgi:heat shock protein HtpX
MALPTLYNQIDENKAKSWYLMIGFILFISILTWIFARALDFTSGDAVGIVGIAFIIAGITNFVSYYYSDKMVLALSHARPIAESDNPDLYHLVENLCVGSGQPVPRMYLIEDSAPNAFATGRDPQNAALCFTTGILQKLDRPELEGVAAHELSHIKNYDTRYMSLVVILVGLTALLADLFMRSLWYGGIRRRGDNRSAGSGGGIFILIGIALAILAPLIAQLIKLAVSRQREYLADASGALLTRYPEGLARALLKLNADTDPLEVANKATAHLYIVNPLHDWGGTLNGLFSTHPPIEERVARLRGMK